jgi:hypothetical protein
MKQTLFIENEEVLPKEFHKINNICAIIYDQITDLFNSEKYSNLFNTDLKLNEQSLDVDLLRSNEIHILDYLKANKLNTELESVLTKHILLSLISDFKNIYKHRNHRLLPPKKSETTNSFIYY